MKLNYILILVLLSLVLFNNCEKNEPSDFDDSINILIDNTKLEFTNIKENSLENKVALIERIGKDNSISSDFIKELLANKIDLFKLDLSKIRLVVGGLGLRNTQDPTFKYSPVTEGFKMGYNSKGKWKDFTDVLKDRNKMVVGYNKKLNKCYLLTVPSVTHGELIKLISAGEEPYDIAISLDGGGSVFMDALGKYVFQGQNSRRIHNIMRFIF